MDDTITLSTPETPDDGGPVDADFTHLAQEAAAIEGGPPVPGTPEAEQAAQATMAEQIAGNVQLIEFAWAIGAPMLPERYAERYGQAERANIAEAYTKLAIKRGWDLGDFFEKWGAEVALVVAVAGPALPVFMADMKRRKEGQGDDGHGQTPN